MVSESATNTASGDLVFNLLWVQVQLESGYASTAMGLQSEARRCLAKANL